MTNQLVAELLHALKTAANDIKHYGDGTGYGKQSVVMTAIRKAEKFLEKPVIERGRGGIEQISPPLDRPTCFGSDPSPQAKAENDCVSCGHESECLKVKPHNMDEMFKFAKSAFNKQEGGDHYRGMKNQPFNFVRENGVPHAEGECIYKLLRWRKKGGIADLRKVIHTIELMIEAEE